ncbi:MAG: hypothetical protein EZS28_005431 [Streblomastix strix]|uniref:Uncharacterized protein n=1 Tax=Streblomastix strix TaxID=222440 RepID=A0A5J4WVR4_9EUKA|nr:MAG: hypothetical protein EZS28_005431 [Streblomastix strix]
MGFWYGLKNFGSKILGGITKAAGWVAPTLNKVLGTLAPPVSMNNPAIGSVTGVGAKLASGQLKLHPITKSSLPKHIIDLRQ